MVMSEAPPLSLHFTSIGINPIPEGETERYVGQVLPTLCIKRDNFEDNNKIDTKEYNAYTGQDTILQGEDRTKGESTPSLSIGLQFDEGLEGFLFAFSGKHDTVVPAITNAVTAKKWKIYRDVSSTVDLPWMTIVDAFNWGTPTASAWINAFVNTIKISMKSDDNPMLEVGTMSDLEKPNQDVPTRTFASTEYRLKANQCKIYMGPADTSEASLESSTYLVDCYTEAEFNGNNNMESKVCGGTPFGTTNKNRKPLTAEGNLKMDYNESNAGLLAEYLTGSSSGTDPTEESMFKSLLFKYTGKKIETVGTAPGTDVYCSLAIYLPKVSISDVKSPRSGDNTKDISLSYKVVSNAQVTTPPISFTLITPCDEIPYGTIPS